MPTLNLDTFPQAFEQYYLEHMPRWRLVHGHVLEDLSTLVPPGETWEELCKGGRNGTLLIVLMLHWWNLATLRLGSPQRILYRIAALDFGWVLRQLRDYVRVLKKPRVGSLAGSSMSTARRTSPRKAAQRPPSPILLSTGVKRYQLVAPTHSSPTISTSYTAPSPTVATPTLVSAKTVAKRKDTGALSGLPNAKRQRKIAEVQPRMSTRLSSRNGTSKHTASSSSQATSSSSKSAEAGSTTVKCKRAQADADTPRRSTRIRSK